MLPHTFDLSKLPSLPPPMPLTADEEKYLNLDYNKMMADILDQRDDEQSINGDRFLAQLKCWVMYGTPLLCMIEDLLVWSRGTSRSSQMRDLSVPISCLKIYYGKEDGCKS